MGELKCPDLDFVYDMTWAEFQIRLFAYKRMDLYRWEQLRELMWVTYIAPHQDVKKMAKRNISIQYSFINSHEWIFFYLFKRLVFIVNT